MTQRDLLMTWKVEMTQIARSQVSSVRTKLGSLWSFEPKGWLIRRFTDPRGLTRPKRWPSSSGNVLETVQCLADARVITAEPLGRICHPLFSRNGARSPFSAHSAVKVESHGNPLGQINVQLHCCHFVALVLDPQAKLPWQLHDNYIILRCMAIIGHNLKCQRRLRSRVVASVVAGPG